MSKKIIAVIAATFPNFDSDDPATTIDAWHIFLADYSYQDISISPPWSGLFLRIFDVIL